MGRLGAVELGEFVREHRTDNGRLRGQAVGFGLLGVLGTTVGLALSVAQGIAPVPGVVLGLGVVGLCLGLSRLVSAVRRRGEAFVLYERGMVYRVAREESVIRWSDVAQVRPMGDERSGVAHALGSDFRCAVRLENGERVRFDTYTKGAGRLARTIVDAVSRGALEKPGRRR